MHRRVLPSLVFCFFAVSSSLGLDTFPLKAREPVVGEKGMVVAVCPHAATIGLKILKKGGNAVDAAVAVGFAEAVTWPEAGNLGGGGFMMILPAPGQKPVCIDYREKAPASSRADMFVQKLDRFHPMVAGVPGTVKGLELAHKKYGSLPWSQLVQPAQELAEKGFLVNAVLARRLNKVLVDPLTTDKEFLKVYSHPMGRAWKEGDTMKLPDLAKTLKRIASGGAQEFYGGQTAKLIASSMEKSGGFITVQDLQNYQAVAREPIHVQYRQFDVYGPPPPSSGGITLALMLNMLETFEPTKDLTLHYHRLAEIMKRAYCDRAQYLGDQDFIKIPAHLTTKRYAQQLVKEISSTKTTPSESLAPQLPLARESNETTHFSVVDGNGMAVSNTYTLENSFGCRVVVPGAGFLLNNEMTDFNIYPGRTTRAGLIGTKPNQIEPGKRMLSSQCPVLVLNQAKIYLITGSPGGRTIINTVLHVLVNVIDRKMNLVEAVDAPRSHHGWFPDRLQLEPNAVTPEIRKKLERLGHEIKLVTQGDAHSIMVTPQGKMLGVADTRLLGQAAGY